MAAGSQTGKTTMTLTVVSRQHATQTDQHTSGTLIFALLTNVLECLRFRFVA